MLLRLWRALAGRPIALDDAVLRRYPALAAARWRSGGLPPRVGGWCLGRRTVAGITLGRTVFLADPARASPGLLLHEVAHVGQFARVRGFPLRYCWESLRRGYTGNRYEVEADAFAQDALRAAAEPSSPAGPARDP